MPQLLNLVRSLQSPADASPSRAMAAMAAVNDAETACAAFFARTARAVPLGPEDRRAMMDAVVSIVAVDNDGPLAVRAPSSAYLHLLVEGWACRAHVLPDGARQITDILLPGDFCDRAPATSRHNVQDVKACGPARVAVLRKHILGREAAALRSSWQWAQDVEAGILRSRVVSLGRRGARERVAHFMSETHERLLQVGLADGGAFTCPLTQEQLADVTGLTSVHVNRVLQRLRREGLLMFNRRRVFIPDIAGLYAAASFEEGPGDPRERL